MRRIRPLLLVGVLALASASCGDVVRDSRAPVILVMDSLLAAQGGMQIGTFGGYLQSDVLTMVTTGGACTTTNPCPTVFNDVGQVTFTLAMKDIGTPGNSTAPSSNNAVTITRYHIAYARTDGRNTPGVDVPYPIDGATTATISGTTTTPIVFEIVRHTSKEEPPLVNLRSSGGVTVTNPGIISTIGTITFYGADQVGNAVTATGSIQIDFGDFGDKQ